MDNQTNQWLKQTLLWQRIVLIGLGLLWLGSVLGVVIQPLVWLSPPDIGEFAIALLAYIIALGWSGVGLWRLHKSIQSTQKYWETKTSIHWQEAMQHQAQFWKHWVLLVLIGVLLILLFFAFLLLLFASGS